MPIAFTPNRSGYAVQASLRQGNVDVAHFTVGRHRYRSRQARVDSRRKVSIAKHSLHASRSLRTRVFASGCGADNVFTCRRSSELVRATRIGNEAVSGL